jgi:hypothetical protein
MWIDHRVLDPGVDEAVPEDIHETHQTLRLAGHDPTQAVPRRQFDPVPLGFGEDPRIERLGMEHVDLIVGKVTAPLVANAHRETVGELGAR